MPGTGHAGWGPGLSILTAMANVLPWLARTSDPSRSSTAWSGWPRTAPVARPIRAGPPCPRTGHAPARLKAWFRDAVEVRDAESAERVLRTAIDVAPPAAVADLLFAAVTDHYFLDAGHTLDFVVKALELLDHLGWSEAAAILPSLVGGLCVAPSAARSGSAWRRPIDLPALVQPAVRGSPVRGSRAMRSGGSPLRPGEFERAGDDPPGEEPRAVIDALVAALRHGTALADLGQAVAHASSLRIARFPTSNEFGDWDTVHNTFSSCNAPAPGVPPGAVPELARGLFHAAMKIYLIAFSTFRRPACPTSGQPGAAPPDGAGPGGAAGALDREQQVTPAGRLVDAHLRSAVTNARCWRPRGARSCGKTPDSTTTRRWKVRVRQYAVLKAARPAAARRALVALARFAAAHSPTSRALRQTYQIARFASTAARSCSSPPEWGAIEAPEGTASAARGRPLAASRFCPSPSESRGPDRPRPGAAGDKISTSR